MVERREHLGLALEAGEPLGIGGEGLGQHLDGDLAAEPGVGGALDLAHAPRAERSGISEATEAHARHETQRWFSFAFRDVWTILPVTDFGHGSILRVDDSVPGQLPRFCAPAHTPRKHPLFILDSLARAGVACLQSSGMELWQ